MTISKRRLIDAKLNSVVSTLERTPPREKKNHISMGLGTDFNKVRGEIGEVYPNLKDDLPAEINTRGPGADMGIAMATFLDLEILCEQLLSLLSLVDET